MTQMSNYLDRFGDKVNENGEKDWNSWTKGVVVALLSAGAIAGALIGSPYVFFCTGSPQLY